MAPTVPEQWMEQAQYDLDTAQAMLESARYLYVLFCCQQAIEKAIKALIAERTGEMPPRLHDLMKLADWADIDPGADRVELFRQLSEYYIASRYPDRVSELSRNATRETARDIFVQTKGSVKWLSSMLR